MYISSIEWATEMKPGYTTTIRMQSISLCIRTLGFVDSAETGRYITQWGENACSILGNKNMIILVDILEWGHKVSLLPMWRCWRTNWKSEAFSTTMSGPILASWQGRPSYTFLLHQPHIPEFAPSDFPLFELMKDGFFRKWQCCHCDR
jgi:hypothetical protein